VLQSWRALGIVAAITAQDGLRRGGFSRLQILVTVAVVLPIAAIGGYLSWRRRRWRVENGDLRLDYGVITHRSRRVPLARLQAIDVVRPLVARALGLAELRLEVVGHRTTEATLSYLTEDQAIAVRAHLLDLAHQPSGQGAQPASAAPAATSDPTSAPAAQPKQAQPPVSSGWGDREEAPLVAVPNGRLVASMLLSEVGFFGLLFMAAAIAVALVAPAAAGVVVATLLPIGAAVYQRFTVEFGFTVALSPQGVRLRHGLLDTRHQTVPRGRVQAIRIVEPLLWRSLGWIRVEVDVAGYRSGGPGSAHTRATSGVLVPVAPRAEAHAVIEAVLPGLRLNTIPLRRPPARARWREPLSYHFLGAAFDAGFSLTSFGRVRRVIDVVPQDKLQSVRLVQGPWERRLDLATVHLDTAGRNVHAAMWHWDATEAARWTDALAAIARSARARQP
jgi:putative membrane protein